MTKLIEHPSGIDDKNIYYKVTNQSECHYGFQYHDGLNHLKGSLAKTGSYVPGGLYFTDLAHITLHLVHGVYVREVQIPPGSLVVEDRGAWRTNQLWFGHRWGLVDFLRDHASSWGVHDWSRISRCGRLTASFIREFSDRVDWYSITHYQLLSEALIREFSDRVNWSRISQRHDISETFIREFANLVDWYLISQRRDLSEAFIREFADRVDWYFIRQRKDLSAEFMQEFFPPSTRRYKISPYLQSPYLQCYIDKLDSKV